MATLVLTAVGTAFGGPIGGALGAMLGQQIDQNILFKPKGREGPRLQELAVQTSSYGSQIPRLYGKMRVAGTVIWATDLKETRQSSGGGKGRPKSTTYSYSTSLAVALSSRKVKSIGRIWADGKIFRGSAGDFKTETGFRFYTGDEDQAPDGLIASAEGAGKTPAYRGLALAVFEDMELSDYGNRIPSLTFEVIADDGVVSLGTIIDDISGGSITASGDETLHGFAAAGQDRRDALTAISDSFSLSFPSVSGTIHAKPRQFDPQAAAIALNSYILSNQNGRAVERPESQILPETKIARQQALRYYDPGRDYQSGMQNAFRPGRSRVIINHDFPAAMSAAQAKNIAQARLWTLYQERSTAKLHVQRSATVLTPGALVQWDDSGDIWRVRQWEMSRGSIALMLSKAGSILPDVATGTDNGRPIREKDLLAGQTRLTLVDLPFALGAPSEVSESSRLYAAAAGDAGWRHAQLFITQADGVTSEYIGQIPAPAIIGTAPDPLGSSKPHVIDRQNTLLVQMHNGRMTLGDADHNQLLAGHNIAAIGREIVQFGYAMPIGNNRYILSYLLRGLAGTETEMGEHLPGEDFVLLKDGELTEIDARHYTPFQPVTLSALGRGDESPVFRSIDEPGRALKPWSPVHPRAVFHQNGGLEIGWTRRSRGGLMWPDYVEIPLAEETEKYRVMIDGQIVAEPAEPALLLSIATVQAYRDQGLSSLTVDVRQIGQHNISDPLTLAVEI
ncbi:phage tail protein [Parasphingorhabdus sp. JC815]|uniref:phage tail protein n=1 Tax=Parasphingorhabdus sp. JC815 TaxID=3232140 RepID=UPI00345AEFCC